MEIRANYVLVGLCTVLVALACLIFVFWIGTRGAAKNTALYDINFASAGSGIGVGTDVLFLGIKVGSIQSIRIDQSLASVRIRIEVDASTPVRADTEATIEMRGVTGGSYIQLSSPNASSPLLEPDRDAIPEIRAGVSKLEQITNNVPGILNSANSLLTTLHQLVDGENSRRIGSILASTDELMGGLAARSADLEAIIESLSASMAHMADLTASLNGLSQGLDGYIRTDLKEITRSFSALATRMDSLANDISPGIARFSGEGLEEFRRLVAEARQMVLTFERLGRKIESDPRRFLFGNSVPEYTP